nr:MAG TPA: hypothetical protein [Bacteriophage sp.]
MNRAIFKIYRHSLRFYSLQTLLLLRIFFGIYSFSNVINKSPFSRIIILIF